MRSGVRADRGCRAGQQRTDQPGRDQRWTDDGNGDDRQRHQRAEHGYTDRNRSGHDGHDRDDGHHRYDHDGDNGSGQPRSHWSGDDRQRHDGWRDDDARHERNRHDEPGHDGCDRTERHDRHERTERHDGHDGNERHGRHDGAERHHGHGRAERNDGDDRTERYDGRERTEHDRWRDPRSGHNRQRRDRVLARADRRVSDRRTAPARRARPAARPRAAAARARARAPRRAAPRAPADRARRARPAPPPEAIRRAARRVRARAAGGICRARPARFRCWHCWRRRRSPRRALCVSRAPIDNESMAGARGFPRAPFQTSLSELTYNQSGDVS